jgi:hypothetical protein
MLAGFVGRNRYTIANFVLMSVASAMCVMLVAARIAVCDSGPLTQPVGRPFKRLHILMLDGRILSCYNNEDVKFITNGMPSD